MKRHRFDNIEMDSTLEYNPLIQAKGTRQILKSSCMRMREEWMQVNFWRETRMRRLRDSRLTWTRTKPLTQM